MKNKFRGHRRADRAEHGAALVIITLFIVALFGFAALSLDVGAVQLQRKRVQEGTDAAALAAVRDWAGGKTDSEVIQVATDFANTNGVKSTELLSIEPGIWVNSSKTFSGPLSTLPANSVPAVRIVAKRTVSTP